MLNTEPEIFEDIFDAFRHFAPSSILLTLDKDSSEWFKSANIYELISMPDGSMTALSAMPVCLLYRGENAVYDHCEASIYRNNKKEDSYDDIGIAIDGIRCMEFKNILLTFPQIQAAITERHKPDFMALAQHYELNTKMLDVSAAPEIAAYFATHMQRGGKMIPIYDGVGCIRGFSSAFYVYEIMRDVPSKLHIFGLQCFKRPGLQFAYGFETERGEDFGNKGWRVYFKQTKRASDIIHTNFHYNEEIGGVDSKSWLFPDEEVADIAALVKKSVKLSQYAVKEYCRENALDMDKLKHDLQSRGIIMTDEPVYKLSSYKKKELEEQYKGKPYGDVSIGAGLSCKPQGE